MDKLLNNRIKLAIQRGLNEAFLNLNIDNIKDIDDGSTYILKKSIDNNDFNIYQLNKKNIEFTKFINKVITNYLYNNNTIEFKDTILRYINDNAKYIADNITLTKILKLTFLVLSNDDNEWVDDERVDLNWIDTSNVTNMSGLFSNCVTFNSDISKWDVSNVTNMAYMFAGTISFNCDISNWDVSNVNSMEHMFYEAEKFKLNIGKWDVSNVEDMSYMFALSYFNQDISKWDVSHTINMVGMFEESKRFNQDISNWDVSNVLDMSCMFKDSYKFNLNIDKWNISSVNNMNNMFEGAKEFNYTLDSWKYKINDKLKKRQFFGTFYNSLVLPEWSL